jgi:alpha-L-fucosidase 2
VAAAGQSLTLDTAVGKHLLVKADRIEPNRIGKYGQLWEWVRDLDDSSNKHRYVTQLWEVYT